MRALPEFLLSQRLPRLTGSTGRRAGQAGDRWPARTRTIQRALADEGGASAVEFALIVVPFLTLCLGMLQFLFLHYTQQTLSDALYNTASSPEAELIAGNKSGYISKLCAKIIFTDACLDSTTGVQVELIRLADLPTATTAIAGTTFNSGSVNDVLVLRAKMPAPQVISFIPRMVASDSVVFRR